MIVHVKMEFDLDTETRRTTNVTPQVVLAEQAHTCRYPACGKTISLDLTYCNRRCFQAHGTRQRTPKIIEASHALPPKELIYVAPEKPRESTAVDYCRFDGFSAVR